jgi:hypothetical protein
MPTLYKYIKKNFLMLNINSLWLKALLKLSYYR